MFWGGQNIDHMLGKMIEDKTQEMAKEGFRPGRYMTREGRTGKDGSGWYEISNKISYKAAAIIQI